MQTNIKNVNSYTRQINVSVPWTDLADKYQAFLKKFSRKIKLPGFRKGKVPAHIIKRQYGSLADADFAEQIVQEYYIAALDEGKQEAINKAEITGLHFHEGSDLRFEATFEVEPEIKLPTYKRGMKVQNITFTHDSVDIDLALKELQQHKSQLRTVESGAEEGYYMLADLQEVDLGGLPIIGSKMESQYLHLTAEGPFAGENMARLQGAKTGDVRRVTLPGPDGQEKQYEVTVTQVSEQIVPELDDEFAKSVEPQAASMQDLREILGQRIQASLDRESAKRISRDLADHFVRNAKLEVPASMVDTYIDNLIHDLRQEGYPEASINREQIAAEQQASIVWNLKWFLLKRQVITEEGLEVEESQVDERITALVADDPPQEKQIRNFYKRPENRRNLKEDILTEALVERLKGYAKVKVINKPSSELRKASQTQ